MASAMRWEETTDRPHNQEAMATGRDRCRTPSGTLGRNVHQVRQFLRGRRPDSETSITVER